MLARQPGMSRPPRVMPRADRPTHVPGQVGLFLADWLPRKAVLDAEQRAALPDVLRRWIPVQPGTPYG